jgi:uncharacterized RDD family membrane protein YckC
MTSITTTTGRLAADDEPDELVTGEGVTLSLRPTNFVLRAAGCLIDYLVYVAAYLLILFAITLTVGPTLDSALFQALSISLLVLCLVGIPTTVETLTRGRSLGKLAVGARVVRDDGGSIGFRHALIRSLLGILEIVSTLGGLAAVFGLLTTRTRRLGDLVAGTFSQHERSRRPVPISIEVPPELVAWASTADAARMPDALARRVAHFIRQSAGMNPVSRDRLAGLLAAEVARWVHPVPPSSPERFLLAVAALRREREATALQREREQLERLAPVLQSAPRGFPDR